MHLSQSEWFAVSIFLVSAAKAIWDIWITNIIFDNCSKDKEGTALTNEVRRKRRRDSLSSVLAFTGIAILTVLIIGEGAMTTEVTREEFDSLDARVKRIEKLIDPPDGGTPEIFQLLQQLDERISSLQTIAAIKKDVDELKRIVAELRKKATVQTIQIPQPSN